MAYPEQAGAAVERFPARSRSSATGRSLLLLVVVLAVLWGLWEGWHWIGTRFEPDLAVPGQRHHDAAPAPDRSGALRAGAGQRARG